MALLGLHPAEEPPRRAEEGMTMTRIAGSLGRVPYICPLPDRSPPGRTGTFHPALVNPRSWMKELLTVYLRLKEGNLVLFEMSLPPRERD